MLVTAEIHADSGQNLEATKWYQRTLKQASCLSMRPLIAHCHAGLKSVYLSVGKEKEAILAGKRALEIYKSLGMTYWLKS